MITPEPVSCWPDPLTLIDTTDGSTRAAIAAYDFGLPATGLVPELDATLKPGVADELWPSSIAAPIPTPAPPKTSAAIPAAAAVVRQCDRSRDGVSHCGPSGA